MRKGRQLASIATQNSRVLAYHPDSDLTNSNSHSHSKGKWGNSGAGGEPQLASYQQASHLLALAAAAAAVTASLPVAVLLAASVAAWLAAREQPLAEVSPTTQHLQQALSASSGLAQQQKLQNEMQQAEQLLVVAISCDPR